MKRSSAESGACYCRVSTRQQKTDSQKSGTTTAIPKRALELRNRGLKIPEIASALNVSERSVFRYLCQFDSVS